MVSEWEWIVCLLALQILPLLPLAVSLSLFHSEGDLQKCFSFNRVHWCTTIFEFCEQQQRAKCLRSLRSSRWSCSTAVFQNMETHEEPVRQNSGTQRGSLVETVRSERCDLLFLCAALCIEPAVLVVCFLSTRSSHAAFTELFVLMISS